MKNFNIFSIKFIHYFSEIFINYLKQKKTVAESEAQARDSQGYKEFLEDMKKTITLSNSLKVKVKVIEYALTMQQSLNKVKLTEMRHS